MQSSLHKVIVISPTFDGLSGWSDTCSLGCRGFNSRQGHMSIKYKIPEIVVHCDICGNLIPAKIDEDDVTVVICEGSTPHGLCLYPHLEHVKFNLDVIVKDHWHVTNINDKLLCEACSRIHSKTLEEAEAEYRNRQRNVLNEVKRKRCNNIDS